VCVEIQCHLDQPDRPANLLDQPLVDAVVATTTWASVYNGDIEIAIVDDPHIHQLNKRHLEHDWETDVISFPYLIPKPSTPVAQRRVVGELIVSWETAVREAHTTGWPPLTELILYIIHGTLHLVGMDDTQPADRTAMRSVEREIMRLLKPAGYELYDVDELRFDSSGNDSSGFDSSGNRT
jgi:probable rRNA maturation factor